MTVPVNPKLTDVYAEFGAPVNTPLSAFLRGGSWVPNGPSANAGVPTALPISLSQLAGAIKLSLAMSSTNGVTHFNPGSGTYSTATAGTATATPTGGSGYTYAWSFTANPDSFSMTNATSQTCSIFCNSSAGPGSCTVQCIVTITGGSTITGSVGVTLT